MKKLSTLTAVATFVATLIGVGFVAFSSYALIARLISHHLENEKKHALIIAKQAVVLPMWNYDELYTQEVLNSFIDDQLDTLVAIRIKGSDGIHQYMSIGKKYRSKGLAALQTDDSIDVLKDRIEYRDRDLGTIEVYYSNAQFTSALRNLGSIIFFISVCMGIAVASTMIYILRKSLTDPLFEIATDATKVGDGHYDVRFRTNYMGELNVVTEAFNETLEAISERDHRLHEQNSQLEELVEKRTRERDIEQLKSFQASRLASLGEMAGAIAHEINNPLTIIQGHSTLLRSALTRKNETELALKAEKIHDTCERIARIIKGLKSFSREGTEDPVAECKIDTLVEDLANLCLNRANQKHIKLSFKFNRDDTVFANATQLGQVIINLINNSIDAVENQKERWIEVSFETRDDISLITVTDSGYGISEDILDKIFNPFFTTKEIGKGTGLGLSISHGIIAKHGGEFFYNKNSKHTQFIILLPRQAHTEIQPLLS